jgi:hypothetical protein
MTDYFDRDGDPMPIPDDWWRRDRDGRRVARTVVGDAVVSTVWLGLNHNPGGVPLIFETMIFGGPWAGEMTRYHTEEDALRGHLRVLHRLRAGMPPFDHIPDLGEVRRAALEALAQAPPETDTDEPHLCRCGRWEPCRHHDGIDDAELP